MKLLNHTSIQYLLFTALLLLISIPVSYVVLNRIFIHAIDRDLYLQANQIPKHQNHIQSERDLELWKTLDNDLEIVPADHTKIQPGPFTQKMAITGKKDEQDFRILQKEINILGAEYVVRIKSSLIEKEELIRTILLIQLSLLGLLLLGTVLINYFINRNVWRPFYKTLSFLENFTLENTNIPTPEKSHIQEFSKLNHSVHLLAISMRRAYLSQKEFAENASHELQTPLAILKSKLELLLQEKDLTENQSLLIEDMNKVIERLEDMNANLLFLIKIENNQFLFTEQFDTAEVVRNVAKDLHFMLDAKSQKLETGSLQNLPILGNRNLFRIMVANLLRNAIQHSENGVVITIRFTPKNISFINPGKPLDLDHAKIFDRFTKSGNRKGNGLGLAIAQKIAELHNLQINYFFTAGMHEFRLMPI